MLAMWSVNRCSGLHLNRSHHSFVFMFQKMAMIDECAHRIGVAKVHAQANARVSKRAAIVVGHVDGVAQNVFLDRRSHIVEQQKMQLMNVKSVQFAAIGFL